MRRAVREGWELLRGTFDAQDVCLVVGVGLLAAGFEQVYAPLVWITPGAALTYLAWPKRPVMMVKSKRQES